MPSAAGLDGELIDPIAAGRAPLRPAFALVRPAANAGHPSHGPVGSSVVWSVPRSGSVRTRRASGSASLGPRCAERIIPAGRVTMLARRRNGRVFGGASRWFGDASSASCPPCGWSRTATQTRWSGGVAGAWRVSVNRGDASHEQLDAHTARFLRRNRSALFSIGMVRAGRFGTPRRLQGGTLGQAMNVVGAVRTRMVLGEQNGEWCSLLDHASLIQTRRRATPSSAGHHTEQTASGSLPASFTVTLPAPGT